jgi:hypothetical protein
LSLGFERLELGYERGRSCIMSGGEKLEGEDVASVWRKVCRLRRSWGCVDLSLAMLRGQVTSGSVMQ